VLLYVLLLSLISVLMPTSTSLEKEVFLILRAFVVSRILPVPGRYKSYYLEIFAHWPNREASALPRRKPLRRPLGSEVAIGIFVFQYCVQVPFYVIFLVFSGTQLKSHRALLDTETFIHPTEVKEAFVFVVKLSWCFSGFASFCGV
jgi:hypothetical protein